MDRLKLETIYLRALDTLMSAIDERQIQAAMPRLRRAQARLHGWDVQAPSIPRSYRRRVPRPHGRSYAGNEPHCNNPLSPRANPVYAFRLDP